MEASSPYLINAIKAFKTSKHLIFLKQCPTAYLVNAPRHNPSSEKFFLPCSGPRIRRSSLPAAAVPRVAPPLSLQPHPTPFHFYLANYTLVFPGCSVGAVRPWQVQEPAAGGKDTCKEELIGNEIAFLLRRPLPALPVDPPLAA